jgi:diguanylate cyclase (GGDEF)-like protein/PAS domain S-box-containing protein
MREDGWSTDHQPRPLVLTFGDEALPSPCATGPDDETLRRIVEHAPYAMVVTDGEGRLLMVNQRIERLFGYRGWELVGRAIEVLVPEAARKTHVAQRREFAERPHPIEMGIGRDVTARHRNGTPFPVEIALNPLETPQGLRVLAAVVDITKRRAAEEALAESETRYRELATHIRDVFLTIDWPSRHATAANPAFEAIWGWSVEALQDNPLLWLEGVHPTDRETIDQALTDTESSGAFDCEYRIISRLGGERIVRHRGFPMRDAHGRVVRVCSIAEDVTERRRADDLLFREKERAQITLASIGDGVVTVDAQGLVDGLNATAESLLGWTIEEARGRSIREVVRILNETTGDVGENPVETCMRLRQVCGFGFPALLLRRDGSQLNVDDSAAPMIDPSGRLLGAVMVFRDVTSQRKLANEVTYHATHDELTGLVNRREFERRLALMLLHGRDKRRPMTVCYIDLDHFKIVNDTCGHLAGDELLRQFAALMRSRVRERDTLARLGGDEFGILLGECALEQARRIADDLRDLIVDFRFTWDGRAFRLGASIGLVPVPAGGELPVVLSAADNACYLAKERGGNRVEVLPPDSHGESERRREMTLLARVQRALAGEGFQLYAQPIVPLQHDDDSPSHLELLLRVTNDSGEALPPGAFISAAERYHQMRAVDRWVVEQTFEALRSRTSTGVAGHCAINLSGQSLGDEEFLRFVLDALDASGVDPSRLCFEITETAAIANLGAAMRFITTLRERGCLFALDDFGSGLSSFAYLKSLPVDYLKIDGRFVRDMVDEPVDAAMVEAIHRVARLMGIKTVAESVESAAVMDKLREIGVDYAQGYGVAMPAPLTIQ